MSNIINNNEDPCSICFESFGKDRPVARIDDIHKFCTPCITEWAQTQLRSAAQRRAEPAVNCPLCRKNITEIDGKPVINPGPEVRARPPVGFDQLQHDEVVLRAVRRRDLARVRERLERYPLSNRARHQAMIDAACDHQLDIVKMLLQDGPIENKCRLKAMKYAKDSNCPAIVDELIKGTSTLFKVRAFFYIK